MYWADQKTRSLRSIGLLIFLVSIGEGMTAPAIPLVGSGLGASYSLIGFFMTGYSVAYCIMTILSGRCSDIWGRKKILLFSIFLCFCASLGYCFAQSSYSLLIFRTLEGMSRGILWVVLEAILADNTLPENRGRESGRFTFFYGMGAMSGCIIGGLVMEYFPLTTVFPAYPVFCVLAFIIGLRGITEVAEGEEVLDGEASAGFPAYWREFKIIWPFCYLFFVYAGFLYSISGMLSMVAGYFQVSYLGIGFTFALFWGCRTISFAVSGRLSDNLGRKPLLMGASIMLAIAAALFIVGASFNSITLAAIFGGMGTGFMYPLLVAGVADNASRGYSGFDLGLMEFIGSLGMITQTGLSGLLGEHGGVQMTYSFTLLVSLVAIVIASFFIKKDKIRSEQNAYDLT
ncbi:MFS transporter [Dehalobacterium formicoaceticum]|uniref:MFS transporter n=1 Tax=Dehalobacterium formicoaceticum TaxID=51515 RepID=A0ABT1Y3B9_9FIRM|nr:MFS transporter [Dehalobacterium formicoaceticum]MCR6545373.1 MFS transporter [Dehalobacterium formicoaceticum]